MSDKKPRGKRKPLVNLPSPREARKSVKNLEDTIQNLVIYNPTPAQRKAKARLLIALEDNPVVSLDNLTAEQASNLSKYDCSKYWSTPGFREWLTGVNEFRERVEYLAYLSLDAAEEILLSDDPKLAGAKVSTISKITELAAKLPNKNSHDSYTDEFIQNMNRRQLEQFLQENMNQLPEADFEDIDE